MLAEQEIEHFLQTGYARLVAAIALVTGSVAVAEDAVQEAIVRAWIASERGQQIESLPAWVTTVAMHRARRWWRRLLSEERAFERLVARTGPATPDPERAIDVRAAMTKLPRRQREVAVLRYVVELSTAEVAATLGIDEGTVKSHLSRARSALARSLEVEEVPDVAT